MTVVVTPTSVDKAIVEDGKAEKVPNQMLLACAAVAAASAATLAGI